MTFTTPVFIAFMAAVFTLYYIIPEKCQWWLLLAASYIFYAYASLVYVIYLLAATCITYGGAVIIENIHGVKVPKEDKKRQAAKAKAVITGVIVLLLLMLGIFKYSQFVLDTVQSVIGWTGGSWKAPLLNMILPVGLSFYIFQSMGYCIDVYRKKINAEHNFLKYMLFVSFFPQLLSGPIGDYGKLGPQLIESHKFDYENVVRGLYRIAWGFFKKLVIANRITLLLQSYTDYGRYYGFFMAMIFFLEVMQLYADFSGYTDIALGCARMLGIRMSENFDSPYLSKSLAEFWRRWHITLGAWFKNYLFYSAFCAGWNQRIRKRFKKTGHAKLAVQVPNVLALIIVWFCTGLWHGASWTFVIWGLCHGFVLIMGNIFEDRYVEWRKNHQRISDSRWFNIFRIVRTFCLMSLIEIVFYVSSMKDVVVILHNMFSKTGLNQVVAYMDRYPVELLALCIGMLILLLVDVYHLDKTRPGISNRIRNLKTWQRWSVYVVLLLFIYFCGAYRGLTDVGFVYFKF